MGRSEKHVAFTGTGSRSKRGHILWLMLDYNKNYFSVFSLFHDHNKLKYKLINIYNMLHLSKVKVI
jgi:hypothetical protein